VGCHPRVGESTTGCRSPALPNASPTTPAIDPRQSDGRRQVDLGPPPQIQHDHGNTLRSSISVRVSDLGKPPRRWCGNFENVLYRTPAERNRPPLSGFCTSATSCARVYDTLKIPTRQPRSRFPEAPALRTRMRLAAVRIRYEAGSSHSMPGQAHTFAAADWTSALRRTWNTSLVRTGGFMDTDAGYRSSGALVNALPVNVAPFTGAA